MSKVSFTINGKLSDLAGETARVRGCRIEPLDETRTLQIDLRRHDRGRVGRKPIGAGRQRFRERVRRLIAAHDIGRPGRR